MSKDFWNTRYRADEFIYGTEPNVYFREKLDRLPPGKILLPGEGEGRNAVYAARKGWIVDCFDISKVARDKALELAKEYGVSINYEVSDVHDFNWTSELYDAVGLTFVHNTPEIRELMHYRAATSLKSGGAMILEAFHKDQLNYDSGGPRSDEMLYDLDELKRDFKNLEVEEIERREVDLDEGRFHKGEAVVVRLFARKQGK